MAIDEFIEDIKSCPTRSGFREIKMPGERGYRASDKSRDVGVEIPDFLWQDVMVLAEELNLDRVKLDNAGRLKDKWAKKIKPEIII